MMRAVLGRPTGSPAVVSIALLLALHGAPTAGAQASPGAPAPTAPASAAAPQPAAAASGQVSVATTASPSAETAGNGAEDERLAWDLENRRFASWNGPTGGIYLLDARGAQPGAVRVQLGLDAFAGSDYLLNNDKVEITGQSIALNVTALRQLELYATLANRSANQSKPDARTIDTLGDVSLGGRIGTRLGKLFDIGADLRGTFTNKVGGGGYEWGATNVALRGALSLDLEQLERPIPLLLRFNAGYVLDNSSVVIKDTEKQRYNALTNPKDKPDETEHLVNRFERERLTIPMGFVHVPPLPGMMKPEDAKRPGLALDRLVEAAHVVVATLARHATARIAA